MPLFPTAVGGPFESEQVLVDRLPGSTYTNLQQFVNTMHSPGVISGGELSVISATQIRVAAGTGMIRVADDNVSSMPFFNWAQTDFTVPADDVVRYLGVVYNSGSPIVEMRTVENWDKDTEIPLGSTLHISSNGILVLTNPFKTGDPITNIIQRFDANAPVLRDNYVGGLIIANTGTRNIAITSGVLWHRLNDNPFASFNSSGASRFTTVYYNGTTWVYTTGVAQWPNTQYNNVASGLVNITGSRYVNLWFYIGATGNNVFMVYGQAQHNQLADAFAEGEPTFFPTNTRPFVVLVGKLTFQNGGATPTQLQSPFTSASLGFGSVNTHNDLSGLQGGTTAEYYHLTSAEHTALTGTIPVSRGGTGITTYAQGDLLYGNASNTLSKLAAQTLPGYFLLSGSTPSWAQLSTNAVTNLSGTANEITSSAAVGSVTLSLPSALTFTGKTVTGGTFNSGAFNGTVGATTPSTGIFTELHAGATTGKDIAVGFFDGTMASVAGFSGGEMYFGGDTYRFFDKTINVQWAGINSTGFQGAIGATTPSTGAFTSLSTSSDVSVPAGGRLMFSSNAYMTPEDNIQGARIRTNGNILMDIGGVGVGQFTPSGLNNTAIGATTPSTGAFTSIINGSTTLLQTSVSLTNGSGASAGTLLNAPSAGNPTKWIPINDNGTTRYIPAW